jgi:preprotein translocase subunit SecG
MFGVLLMIIHITVAVLLVAIVLLQSGKGAGLSGLFGGGASAEQLFSAPSGGSFLRKATITLAVVFAITSLALTFTASRRAMESVAVSKAVGGQQ